MSRLRRSGDGRGRLRARGVEADAGAPASIPSLRRARPRIASRSVARRLRQVRLNSEPRHDQSPAHAQDLEPQRRRRDARRHRLVRRLRHLHEAGHGRPSAVRGAVPARCGREPHLRLAGCRAGTRARHRLRAPPSAAAEGRRGDDQRALLHRGACSHADRRCDRHHSDHAADRHPGRRPPSRRAGRDRARRACAGGFCRGFPGRAAGTGGDFVSGSAGFRVRGVGRGARS